MMEPDEQKAQLYDEARARGLSPDEAVNYAESGGRSGARGVLRGIAAPLAQGATFGFADEITGAVRGALDPDMTASEGIAAERGEADRFRGGHPILSGGAELASGLATGGAAVRALKGIPTAARAMSTLRGVPRLAANAGAAMAGGATYGFGAAEGAPGERIGDAGTAAAVTLPFMAVAPVAGRALRGVTSRTASGAAEIAERKTLQALERSGRSLDDVDAAVTAAGDKPVTVLDVGGENVQGLGRLAGNVPGRGREVMAERLTERAEGQGARALDDLERAFGQRAGDVEELADDLATQQASRAKKPYEDAYAHGPVDDPEINRLIEGGGRRFEQAYDHAREIIKLRDDIDLPPLYTELKSGNRAINPPTVEALDRMKRALDRTIRSGGNSTSAADRDMAMAVRDRLGKVLQRVDDIVPEYRQARNTWAGDEAVEEALEAGRTALRGRPADIRKALRDLSTDSERDMYRRGVLEELRHRVAKTGDTHDAVRQLFGNEEMRNRIAAAFPTEEAFAEWAERSNVERQMTRGRNSVAVGSRTQPMQMEADDFAADVIGQAASGGQAGVLKSVWRWLTDQRMTEKVASGTADILSMPGRDAVNRLRGYQASPTGTGVRRLAGYVAGGGQVGAASSRSAVDSERRRARGY